MDIWNFNFGSVGALVGQTLTAYYRLISLLGLTSQRVLLISRTIGWILAVHHRRQALKSNYSTWIIQIRLN